MKPLHIDPNCPECGEALTLLDILCDPDIKADEIWSDEWACPKCDDEGICYMDWPQEDLDEIARRAQEATDHPEKMRTWEDIREDIFSDLSKEQKELYFKESEERAKNITEKKLAEFSKQIRIIKNIKIK